MSLYLLIYMARLQTFNEYVPLREDEGGDYVYVQKMHSDPGPRRMCT